MEIALFIYENQKKERSKPDTGGSDFDRCSVGSGDWILRSILLLLARRAALLRAFAARPLKTPTLRRFLYAASNPSQQLTNRKEARWASFLLCYQHTFDTNEPRR